MKRDVINFKGSGISKIDQVNAATELQQVTDRTETTTSEDNSSPANLPGVEGRGVLEGSSARTK